MRRRQRWWPRAEAAWNWLMRAHVGRRHPVPFSKSERGRLRREERRFKLQQKDITS